MGKRGKAFGGFFGDSKLTEKRRDVGPVLEGWWSYNRWTLEMEVELPWTELEVEKAEKHKRVWMASQNRQQLYEDLGVTFKVFEPPSELAGCVAVWRREEMMSEYWVEKEG